MVCLGLGVDEAIQDFSWCFSSLFDKFCKICRTCEHLSSLISTRNIDKGFPLFSWTLNVQGFRVYYSSNGLPLVVPFWNYYLGHPSFSKSGYQPIFYGEVFEVPGIL